MPFKILVVNRPVLSAEPCLHKWTVYVVVIDPPLIAGIVRRIDVYAIDTVGVAGEQRFESMQVIAVDDEIIVGSQRDCRSGFRQVQVGW